MYSKHTCPPPYIFLGRVALGIPRYPLPRKYHRILQIKDGPTTLLFQFRREIGAFSQAWIAFPQKLKRQLRKRHFFSFRFLKKSNVELRFEEGSLFLENHTVIIVLSTEELKSILFGDHDRISKMPWLCHPSSHPVQDLVFCILYGVQTRFTE